MLQNQLPCSHVQDFMSFIVNMSFKSVCFIVTISICIGLLPGSSGQQYSENAAMEIKVCLSPLCSRIEAVAPNSYTYSSFKDWYNEISIEEPQDVTTIENWVQRRMDEYTTTLKNVNLGGTVDEDIKRAIDCNDEVIQNTGIGNNINNILEDARAELNSSEFYPVNKGFENNSYKTGTVASANTGYYDNSSHQAQVYPAYGQQESMSYGDSYHWPTD